MRRLALAGALLLAACGELPFAAAPSPTRTPPPPPPQTPSPTPAPKPQVEVLRVLVAPLEKAGPKFVAIAFRLRNPSATEWLFQGQATATLTTPDGRLLPTVKPATTVDLAPAEQKWFAFAPVDTLGSIVGNAEVTVGGGQWLPAALYPYPGGVPISAARRTAAPSPVPGVEGSALFVVQNGGDLGVNGALRAFAFDGDVFVGLVDCPTRLYPARSEVVATCGTLRADALKAQQLLFVAYPDLRPVLVPPTGSPSPRP